MFRCAQHARKEPSTASSAADRDHLTIRLVIVSEIVLCRFALDHIEKELLELLVSRAGPKRLHDVELKIAAKARTQFTIACEAKSVAAFAEMQVCHCTDQADGVVRTSNEA